MNEYELALVINGNLTDEARDEALEKVKQIIETENGSIFKVDDWWGGRILQYDIGKTREFFYYFISFDAETGEPFMMEQEIRKIDEVIRFLIVKTEK